MDTKTEKSRGFCFIEFEDDDSVERALQFNGMDGPEVAKMVAHGKRLVVERARQKERSSDGEKERELRQLTEQNESAERDLRLRKARIQDLGSEVETVLARQQELARNFSKRRNVQAELDRQRRRQDQLKKQRESLARDEALWLFALRAEEDRVRAMEDMAGSAPGEQTQLHIDEGRVSITLDEKVLPVAGVEASPSLAPSSPTWKNEVDSEDDEEHRPVLRVKNTFYELSVPAAGVLVRTKTAPPDYAPMDYSSAQDSPRPSGDELPELEPTAPWVLRRQTTREKLDEQRESDDLARQLLMDKSEPAKSEAAKGSSAEKDKRREVRIKNIPTKMCENEVEQMLMQELERLWIRDRPRRRLQVDEMRIEKAQSYAQALCGQEVYVSFVDADDAAWLVQACQGGIWSRRGLSLGGRLLHVEYATQPPVDWRKLRFQADTDASSLVSYATVGTRQSCNTVCVTSPDGRSLNRTIVLEGLPTSWPEHQVRGEVLAMLKRLWEDDSGLTFDAGRQLHKGSDGGISVRKGLRGHENCGSCIVRLRAYADAKWIVDMGAQSSTRGRFVVGGGTRLKVSWARRRY